MVDYLTPFRGDTDRNLGAKWSNFRIIRSPIKHTMTDLNFVVGSTSSVNPRVGRIEQNSTDMPEVYINCLTLHKFFF